MDFLKDNLIYLREQLNINQAEFGKLFGLSRDNIASYERGTEPKVGKLLEIVNYFHISMEDILTSSIKEIKGSNLGSNLGSKYQILSENDSLSLVSEPVQKYLNPKFLTIDSQGNENIVFVGIKASAGYLNGYADQEYIEKLPAYRMPGLNNGSFRMFEIKGHSMKGTIEDHDKVIGEWVSPLDVKDEMVHIVVSRTEGIVIKRCINRIKESGVLILKSDNRDYDTIILEVDDILEVWKAKLKLTHKFPAPADTLNRITDLEAKFAMLERAIKK